MLKSHNFKSHLQGPLVSFLSALRNTTLSEPTRSNQSEGQTGFCTSYLYSRWSGRRGGSGLINCVMLTVSEQSKWTFYGTFLSSGLIWAISMVMLSVFHTQEWLVKYSKTIMDLCRRVIVFIILRWTSGKFKIKGNEMKRGDGEERTGGCEETRWTTTEETGRAGGGQKRW